MALFKYSGFDQSGGRVSGTIEAANASQAKQKLQHQGLLLTDLVEYQTRSSLFPAKKISLADLEFFTAELSLLLDSGLKIDKSIDLLLKTSQKPSLISLLSKVSRSLSEGMELSVALKQADPEVFDPLYVNLVAIGETTGHLAGVFTQLARNLAFRRELQQKMQQALLYPSVILFVCVAAIVAIFNFVVPNLAPVFSGKADLPAYTTFLLAASQWMLHYQWLLLLALVFSFVVFKRMLSLPDVRRRVSDFQLSIPFIQKFALLTERIRFNSGLSMMLSAGVPVDRALELALGSVQNLLLRDELMVAIQKIKRGERLSEALKQSRLYPTIFVSLLNVGEETGGLGRIFEEITVRSQKEFSAWVSKFTSLLEPLLIVFMGGVVGSVVVTMMLSITGTTSVGL